jgi:3',5'-cyclic AMP phosphodiesterase CpdA
VRILHFSDIHLGLGIRRVPLGDLFSKRAIGLLNLLRARGRQLAGASRKMEALVRLFREQKPDLVIFSGDYTNLSTHAELAAAREAVEPLTAAPAGYVNVPGNHDLYTLGTLRQHRFESHFGDLLETDAPEHRVDGPWPLVRLVGEDVAVVAVNSARPNPAPWLSSGCVPASQLEALGRILDDPRLLDRFVFVVTHYAPRRADGRPDRLDHRMKNAEDFLTACATIRHGAILCGHIHRTFRLRLANIRPTIYCAGSATISGREGLWLFELEGRSLRATQARWDGAQFVADDEPSGGDAAGGRRS